MNEIVNLCKILVETINQYPQGVDDKVAFEGMRTFMPDLAYSEFTRIINMLALEGKIRRRNRVMYPIAPK